MLEILQFPLSAFFTFSLIIHDIEFFRRGQNRVGSSGLVRRSAAAEHWIIVGWIFNLSPFPVSYALVWNTWTLIRST